ncbi:peptidase M4 domain-containing protein [Gottschalkia purinilytica]|uniref:Peptidase M4 domain-containing protein n=1 Tax=Gottschalkia purinilytica TaxID=1503 RepID=A0A0L0WDN2_GOTPU|nr:PepSY domain-containing protein [Gottschalkia purinilytica]KNF09584.1 peptidase M4 domain-containing protein [Gottschalkia purinilytica]
MLRYYYNTWDYWINYRIDIETAIRIALRQVPGRVIKAELDTENGLLVYEVKILTDYGVYEVKINADTGRIIEIDRD